MTEATVLALLQQSPYTRFNATLVARRLGCGTELAIALLNAVAKRGAIRVETSRLGEPAYSALPDDTKLQDLREIVARGELENDYNGARRHWELCMTIRRT